MGMAVNSWDEAARDALCAAVASLEDDHSDDAIVAATRGLGLLYRMVGESPDTVVLSAGDLSLDPERGPECTCPRELRARGGYRSTCPDHGR